jgi:hypothetical protein
MKGKKRCVPGRTGLLLAKCAQEFIRGGVQLQEMIHKNEF